MLLGWRVLNEQVGDLDPYSVPGVLWGSGYPPKHRPKASSDCSGSLQTELSTCEGL